MMMMGPRGDESDTIFNFIFSQTKYVSITSKQVPVGDPFFTETEKCRLPSEKLKYH